mgnify:CR=1 FL=1|tara:strand:+ start:7961 stop:8986 length:1026 start_codon:yes stop_codon:yes gene_type:complete
MKPRENQSKACCGGWLAVSAASVFSLLLILFILSQKLNRPPSVSADWTDSQGPSKPRIRAAHTLPTPTLNSRASRVDGPASPIFEEACAEDVLLAPNCSWGPLVLTGIKQRAGLADVWMTLKPALEASRDRVARKLIPLFADMEAPIGHKVAMSFMVEELWGEVPSTLQGALYAYSYGDQRAIVGAEFQELGELLYLLRNEENRVSDEILATIPAARVQELRADGTLSECSIHLRCNPLSSPLPPNLTLTLEPPPQGHLGALLLPANKSNGFSTTVFANIEPGGPAEIAGIENGDTLLYVDDIPGIDAAGYVESKGPGTVLTFELQRGAVPVIISATLIGR